MEYFALWLVVAIVTAVVASSRGRSAFGWFVLGFLISIFALILVALLPSLKKAPPVVGQEAPTPATHVRCPDCKEFVLNEARVCKHCGARLVPASEQPRYSDLAKVPPIRPRD